MNKVSLCKVRCEVTVHFFLPAGVPLPTAICWDVHLPSLNCFCTFVKNSYILWSETCIAVFVSEENCKWRQILGVFLLSPPLYQHRRFSWGGVLAARVIYVAGEGLCGKGDRTGLYPWCYNLTSVKLTFPNLCWALPRQSPWDHFLKPWILPVGFLLKQDDWRKSVHIVLPHIYF